jgi:hypothetical protein
MRMKKPEMWKPSDKAGKLKTWNFSTIKFGEKNAEKFFMTCVS